MRAGCQRKAKRLRWRELTLSSIPRRTGLVKDRNLCTCQRKPKSRVGLRHHLARGDAADWNSRPVLTRRSSQRGTRRMRKRQPTGFQQRSEARGNPARTFGDLSPCGDEFGCDCAASSVPACVVLCPSFSHPYRRRSLSARAREIISRGSWNGAPPEGAQPESSKPVPNLATAPRCINTAGEIRTTRLSRRSRERTARRAGGIIVET